MKQLFPFSVNDPLPPVKQITSVTQYGYTDNGNDILDLSLGSCGCFPLGFKRNDLVDAVTSQLKDSPFCQGDFVTTHPLVTELSDKLYKLSNGFYSIYSLSGSDAVEGAIKLVKMFHKDSNKKKIIGFKKAYHGSTYMSSSVSGTFYITDAFGKQEDCVAIDYDELETTVDTNTAAIIIETASWGGKNLGKTDKQYFKKVRELCDTVGALMIIDDIAFCGGKTGTILGFKNLEVEPDICCLGKGISGGYFPLSVTMLNQKVADIIKPQFLLHGFSYSFPMAGIISTLEYFKILEQENILAQHSVVVDSAKTLINELLDLKLISDWHSHGVCFSITPTNMMQDPTERDQHFYSYGLHLGVWNQNSDRVLIMMPIVFDVEYFKSLRSKLIAALR
jgi:adenosylmethionine-8-amino-7-oxononanoate aminotransferase